MNAQTRLRFRLAIPAEEYLAYYRREAGEVVALSEDGRNVQFPASALQRFVSHAGVYGRFEIVFDDRHKLLALNRLGD